MDFYQGIIQYEHCHHNHNFAHCIVVVVSMSDGDRLVRFPLLHNHLVAP